MKDLAPPAGVKDLAPPAGVKDLAPRTGVKDLARRWFEEAWNQGSTPIGDELIDPSFVLRGRGNATPGPDPLLAVIRAGRTGFPDLAYTIEDQIAEGDQVVTRWTFRGTHTGPFAGLTPTGNRVELPGATIFRFRDGRIVDYATFWDTGELRRQITRDS